MIRKIELYPIRDTVNLQQYKKGGLVEDPTQKTNINIKIGEDKKPEKKKRRKKRKTIKKMPPKMLGSFQPRLLSSFQPLTGSTGYTFPPVVPGPIKPPETKQEPKQDTLNEQIKNLENYIKSELERFKPAQPPPKEPTPEEEESPPVTPIYSSSSSSDPQSTTYYYTPPESPTADELDPNRYQFPEEEATFRISNIVPPSITSKPILYNPNPWRIENRPDFNDDVLLGSSSILDRQPRIPQPLPVNFNLGSLPIRIPALPRLEEKYEMEPQEMPGIPYIDVSEQAGHPEHPAQQQQELEEFSKSIKFGSSKKKKEKAEPKKKGRKPKQGLVIEV